MTRVYKTVLCILLLLCSLSFVHATKEAHAQPAVKVAFRSFPPWMIVGEESSGFDHDLLEEVFKHMGLKVEFVLGSFEDNLKKLESGEVEVLSSLLYRNERNTFIRYISPPYKTNSIKSFYVRKDSDIKIKKYMDLAGLKVAVARDAKYFPAFDLDDRMSKVVCDTSTDTFVALSRGEVDVTICTDSVGDYFIKDLDLESKIKVCSFKYKPKLMPVYFGISRKSPLFGRVEEIEAVMRYLQKSGKTEQLAKKYSVNLH